MTRPFGCHISSAGGYDKIIDRATALNITAAQVHPCPPQKWNSAPFAPGIEKKYLERKKDSPLQTLVFHGIYLINLCNPDPRMQHLSKLSLIHDLELSARMEVPGVIFHVGSFKDEPDEAAGYDRIAKAIDEVLAKTSKESKLYMEVSAGAGKVIGSKTAHLQKIAGMLGDRSRVRFALDTQHLWASGYDLVNNLEGLVSELGTNFGFENIAVIHLNDSKTALASTKDRHENLGDGLIGKEALTNFINHPKLAQIPVILETPGLKEEDTAKIEVEKLRAIVK